MNLKFVFAMVAMPLVAMAQQSARASFPLDKVRFIGRWYKSGATWKQSWGPGTFIARFRGSTSISATLGNTQELYHVCQVDDGAPVRVPHTSGEIVIGTNLSPSENHTVWCGRSDEASYGDTTLTAITIDQGGVALDPDGPFDTQLRYEVVGDSITAGFKVYGSPAARTEDVFKTYGKYLADAWATPEWSVVARSGISLTPYGGGAERVMAEQWPCQDFSWGACPQDWSFTGWQADVVTINLGTNDYAFGNPTQATLAAAYVKFIGMVRTKYPNALILCIEPLQVSCGGGGPKWVTLEAGVKQAVTQVGDDKVVYVPTGTVKDPWLVCATDYSDYTHPTVAGHLKFANKLLETGLTDIVRKFFPNKCKGTGPKCTPI